MVSWDVTSFFFGFLYVLRLPCKLHFVNRSHNFRPSYMRLRASLLCTRLNIGCILAMTATATTTTLNAIMSALEIPSTNLIQNAKLRDNMQLSVSLSGNRQVQMTFFPFGYSIFF